MHRYIIVLVFAALLATTTAAPLIWIEGEAADSSSMKRHGWYDSVRKGELSGGDWLSHFAGGEMPVASYTIETAEGGAHQFWLRANPVGRATLSVRLNEGEWRKIDLSANEQNVNIADDGKPDLRYVAWIKAESLTLRQGTNQLDVRFESRNNRHGGLDCFVLSREPFLPQGAKRPGVKTGKADPGTWAFEPDRDPFHKDALLDLTFLNEKPAGSNGYVRRSNDGADFVDGLGRPLRFWAVNTSVHQRDDLEAIKEHARWLAKRGVNMVRHHGHLAPGRGSKLKDVNQKDIDAAWRLVAAMRAEGIYTTLSPYWASNVRPQPGWGLKDSGNDSLTGLLFFDATLQEAYKGWLRALLIPENPHTGIPLAKDPSVALFQIQNEDSLLFWTEGHIKGEQRRELARLFGVWLVEKHGSLPQATETWGGRAGNRGDDFANGIVMPHVVWHFTQSPTGALAKRLADQLAFYTHLMRSFNEEIARFLREELGYEGLINAGNWRTADSAKLLDAERYAYTANDVIGINRYYHGGGHTNPTEKGRTGYLISQGDRFSSQSALKQPWNFPLALRQVQGHPMIISESAWVPPLRYQSEGPFLVAAYGALTGFDTFYWFATPDIGFGAPIDKWQLSTPAQIGMFPAAALMFRRGYVAQGEPALVEHRSLEEVWAMRVPLLSERAGYDPNQDSKLPASRIDARLTPLTFLAGPVKVSFKEGDAQLTDLRSLIDSEAQTVTSTTGQLRWDYGKGVCTLNAPKAQGVTGALNQSGDIDLSALTITSKNDYATFLAVSIDGGELTESEGILLQIGTTARPHGWKTSPINGTNQHRIDDLGSSPWNIENTQITCVLKNPKIDKATQLDPNGMVIRDLSVERVRDGLRIEFPHDAMYVMLRKAGKE